MSNAQTLSITKDCDGPVKADNAGNSIKSPHHPVTSLGYCYGITLCYHDEMIPLQIPNNYRVTYDPEQACLSNSILMANSFIGYHNYLGSKRRAMGCFKPNA